MSNITNLITVSTEDNNQKKQITLNPEAFYGRIEHKNILSKLLKEIVPVDFYKLLDVSDIFEFKQKHYIYGVIKHLLAVSKQQNWNLCKAFDYTYIYNGAFWKQFNKEDLKSFLTDVGMNMGIPEYNAKHYEFADQLLKQFLRAAHLQIREPEPDKIKINLQNGTFEFTSDGFVHRDFSADDFLTYQIPFAYDVSADCPIFRNYLNRVLPDITSQMVLQEFCGFVFTNLNLEKCLVLTGPGQNGKSVFFNIINSLFGKENILNYSLGLFGHEYNRAKLTNVLLNYSSEKGIDLNPDTFKALVSGEPLQAREPYGKPFTLLNRVRFIINCNELPRETESTDAYFRRFIIIPFDVKITESEKDISLADKIIAKELPGIFNWVLEGLERLIKNQRFTDCIKSEQALINFRKQADSVQLFIEENNYTKSDSRKIALADLFSLYKEFCKEDNYKPVGKKKFSNRLVSQNFEPTRTNDGSTAYFIVKSIPTN